MGYTPSNDDDLLKRVDAFIGQSPTQPTGNSKAEALRRAADRLGVDAADLGAIISFESAGTFNPHKVGGEGNKYKGLIQFGPAEQKRYYKPNDTFETQVEDGVVRYFQDRFKQAGKDTRGATLEDLYTTVIAGNPKANRDAKDAFGTSARSGAQKILKEHRPKVLQNIFGGQSPSINDADFWDEIRQVVGQEDVAQADDPQFWGEIKNLVDEPSAVKPVTEKPETIDAQIQASLDPHVKTRFGVLTTDPSQNAMFGNRSDFLGIPVKEGMLWVNPKKIIANKKLKLKNENDIRQYVEKNPKALTTLIGISEDVGNNTQGTAITAKDPNTGLELATGVVTNPASAIEQAQNYKDQFPNADISVTNTDDVVRQREEVDLLAPTSPTGEADDPDEQGLLQARFAEAQKADPSLTVEKFNQILRDEEEQKFLAANADYAEFLKQTGLPNTPESQKEYNLAQQASVAGANKQNRIDVEAYNKALPRQIQGQAQIETKAPDSPGVGSKGFIVDVDYSKKPANIGYDEWQNDLVAERLSNETGVSFNVAKAIVEAEPTSFSKDNAAVDTATREAIAKSDNPIQRVQVSPSLLSKAYAYQNKTDKDTEKLRVAREKILATDPDLNVTPDILEVRAKAEAGLISGYEAIKQEAYLQKDYGDWLVKKGYADTDEVRKAYGMAEKEKRFGWRDLLELANPLIFGQNKGDVKKQIQDDLQNDILEYGSVKNALKVYDKLDEQRKFSGGIGQPAEALKTAARYVAKLPATALEALAIQADTDPIVAGVEILNGDTGLRKMLMTAAKDWRNTVDKDLALKQNKAYRDDFIVNELSEGLAQFAVQMIAAPLTGGASVALGAFEGGTAQYRNADEKGAGKGSRLLAATTGAALAFPDMLLKAKYLKSLSGNGQMSFLSKMTEGIFNRLSKFMGEEEARVITKQTIGGFIKNAAKNGIVNFGGEYGQEQAEDIGNGIVEKLTYNPNVTWKDVFVPTDKARRGYLAAGFAGLGGTAVETITERMSDNELLKAAQEIAKAQVDKLITQQQADQWLKASEQALENRKQYFAKDAEIQSQSAQAPEKTAKPVVIPDTLGPENAIERAVAADEAVTDEVTKGKLVRSTEVAEDVKAQRLGMLKGTVEQEKPVEQSFEENPPAKPKTAPSEYTLEQRLSDLEDVYQQILSDNPDLTPEQKKILEVRRAHKLAETKEKFSVAPKTKPSANRMAEIQAEQDRINDELILNPNFKAEDAGEDFTYKESPETVAEWRKQGEQATTEELEAGLKRLDPEKNFTQRQLIQVELKKRSNNKAPVEEKAKTIESPTYKVGDTVTTPNGKVKGTVESVKGDTLGVAWENAPVEGDITETTADKVKPVTQSAVVKQESVAEIKTLRDLGYTLPMQKTLSNEQKQEIIAQGIKRKDYVADEKAKPIDAPTSYYKGKPVTVYEVDEDTVNVKYADGKREWGVPKDEVSNDALMMASPSIYTEQEFEIDNALQKARTPKSVTLLQSLRGKEITPDEISKVRSKNTRYGVEINEIGNEIANRIAREAGLGTTEFDGVFLDPNQVQKFVTVADELALSLGEAGKPISKMADAIEKRFNERGVASLYIYDDAARHEAIHEASYLGSLEQNNVAKALEKRYDGALEELKGYEPFKTFKEALKGIEGREINNGVAMEEAMAWLGDGQYDRFKLYDDDGNVTAELTEDDAVEILAKLVEGYATANGVESLSNFGDGTKLYEVIKEFGKSESTEVSDGSGSEVSGEREARQETAEGESAETGAKENRKLASLPQTLRKYGRDAVDVAYTVYGDTEATNDAVAMFYENGIDGSITLLKNIKDPDASHTILAGIVYDTLLNQSLATQNSDVRLKADKFLLDVSNRLIKAGRFIRAVQLMQHAPVVAVVQGAQKIAESVDNNLSDSEITKFTDLAHKLEAALAESAMYKKQAETLREENKKLQESVALSDQHKTQAKNARKTIAKRINNDFGQEVQQAVNRVNVALSKDQALQMAVKNESEVPSDLIDDLSKVAALHLVNGFATDTPFLPETLEEIMATQFGEDIRPVFSEVYVKALKQRDKWLNVETAKTRRNLAENKRDVLPDREFSEKLTDLEVLEIIGAIRDMKRKQRAVEQIHRLATGVRGKKVSPEMEQTIMTLANGDQYELEVQSAILAAQEVSPKDFYEVMGEKGVSEQQAKKLFVRGQDIVANAKEVIKEHKASIKQVIVEQTQAISDVEVAEIDARKRLDNTKKQIQDEYEKLTSPKKHFAKKAYLTVMDLLRNLTLSAELSFLMRQGGKTIRSEALTYVPRTIANKIKGVPAMESNPAVRGALRTLLPETVMGKPVPTMGGQMGERGYAENIKGIENHSLFNEAVKLGLDFSTAGKLGQGSHIGEEQLQSEAIDNLVEWLNKNVITRNTVAYYPRMIQRFDKSMAIFLDNLRMKLYERFSNELRSQGLDPSTDKAEFEELVKRINSGTSRPNKFKGLRQQAVDLAVESRLFLAPSYTVAKWEDMGADVRNTATAIAKAVAFQGLPKGTQRVMLKRAFASYSALTLQYALLAYALGGLVSFDPDDDDFLKLKLGNYRYDLTQGNRSELKYIGQIIKHYDDPNSALRSSTKYLRTRLNILPSFALNAWYGKDVAGQEFSLKDPARYAQLVAPLTWSNAVKNYATYGGEGVLKTLPFDFVGYGTALYPDREKATSLAQDVRSGKMSAEDAKATIRQQAQDGLITNKQKQARLKAVDLDTVEASVKNARATSEDDFKKLTKILQNIDPESKNDVRVLMFTKIANKFKDGSAKSRADAQKLRQLVNEYLK